MFRFLHSADLHLGKPFGRFAPELRGRLKAARIDVLPRLAEAARSAGAETIVLAGDVFDAAEPERAVVRQALDAIGAEADLRWLALPGNHDPHRPGGLWERIAADPPPNLTPLLDERPQAIAPGVAALPAPCRGRVAGRDLTAWMDAAESPPGAIRLGIAHGPARAFGSDDADALAEDRPERAGLAYLALGDWHGRFEVGPRMRYPGAPEPTGFKDNAQGSALAVALAGPVAPPSVEPVPTGRFLWAQGAIDLLPGADAAPLIAPLLGRTPRRDALLRLAVRGEITLPERAALAETLDALGAGLAFLEADLAGLATRREAADLDAIAEAGPLREAAAGLMAASTEDAAAREALELLYSWSLDAEAEA